MPVRMFVCGFTHNQKRHNYAYLFPRLDTFIYAMHCQFRAMPTKLFSVRDGMLQYVTIANHSESLVRVFLINYLHYRPKKISVLPNYQSSNITRGYISRRNGNNTLFEQITIYRSFWTIIDAVMDSVSIMDGVPLVRMSSFDRLMQQCGGNFSNHNSEAVPTKIQTTNASLVIQHWWKKVAQQLKLYQLLTTLASQAGTVLNTLGRFRQSPVPPFHQCTQQLGSNEYMMALSSILNTLPLDPSLKSKNTMARHPRTLSSCVLIAWHPHEVLLDDADQLDESGNRNDRNDT